MNDSDSDDESVETIDLEALEPLLDAIRNGEPLESIRPILETTETTDEAHLVIIILYAISHHADYNVTCALIQRQPNAARIPLGGSFLLHKACCRNAPIQVIRLLIELNPGALDLSSQTDQGMLPLHCPVLPRILPSMSFDCYYLIDPKLLGRLILEESFHSMSPLLIRHRWTFLCSYSSAILKLHE